MQGIKSNPAAGESSRSEVLLRHPRRRARAMQSLHGLLRLAIAEAVLEQHPYSLLFTLDCLQCDCLQSQLDTRQPFLRFRKFFLRS